MPNYFADELEYFISKLPSRECAIISLHPHNDRGCGVATAEMGLLAGAERIEATLFGNGERTGNVDIVTLAPQYAYPGSGPELGLLPINQIREMYERCTKMKVGERQPYAGECGLTPPSPVPIRTPSTRAPKYCGRAAPASGRSLSPIDPADVGREYEPIIRINSQSGKGGAAFVMQHSFGFDLPKAMHPEFGHIVQVETDRVGTELKPERIYSSSRRTTSTQ